MDDVRLGIGLVGYVLIVALLLALVMFSFCGVPALAFRFILTGCAS